MAYSPRNSILESLLLNAVEFLNASDFLTVAAQNDASSLEQSLRRHNSLAAVEFPDFYGLLDAFPQNLEFALRFPAELRTKLPTTPIELSNWFTNLKFPSFPEYGPRNGNDHDGGAPGYYREGFAAVQAAISHAFIKYWNKNSQELPPILLQRFPYPGYVSDSLLKGLEYALPLVILISLLSSVINITKVSHL